jgi:hypothetical protein
VHPVTLAHWLTPPSPSPLLHHTALSHCDVLPLSHHHRPACVLAVGSQLPHCLRQLCTDCWQPACCLTSRLFLCRHLLPHQCPSKKGGVDSKVISLSTPPFSPSLQANRAAPRFAPQTLPLPPPSAPLVPQQERGCRLRGDLAVYTPFLHLSSCCTVAPPPPLPLFAT